MSDGAAGEPSKGSVASVPTADAASYPLEGIDHPGINDVMFGRGGETNYHIGNHRFRVLADEHRDGYRNSNRKGKAAVVQEVVRIWRARSPPGRFLAKTDPEKGDQSLWHDVGNDVARKKAAKILSERASVARQRNQENRTTSSNSASNTSNAPTPSSISASAASSNANVASSNTPSSITASSSAGGSSRGRKRRSDGTLDQDRQPKTRPYLLDIQPAPTTSSSASSLGGGGAAAAAGAVGSGGNASAVSACAAAAAASALRTGPSLAALGQGLGQGLGAHNFLRAQLPASLNLNLTTSSLTNNLPLHQQARSGLSSFLGGASALELLRLRSANQSLANPPGFPTGAGAAHSAMLASILQREAEAASVRAMLANTILSRQLGLVSASNHLAPPSNTFQGQTLDRINVEQLLQLARNARDREMNAGRLPVEEESKTNTGTGTHNDGGHRDDNHGGNPPPQAG